MHWQSSTKTVSLFQEDGHSENSTKPVEETLPKAKSLV
ncbi:unnamed protein product [Arabidopsis thaliana]|uniref:(thale cress) hypothetical protein n=1 Tax=Arabidopsis thaliana TaxID=3702 RepID=A0A7G2EXP1_ARATH|nr:unnamed protein product [Arabidopsis thaliana]